MKTAKSKIQLALDLKSNVQIAVGLGVLLLLIFAAFYKTPTSAKSQTTLEKANDLLQVRSKQNAAQALPLLNKAARLTPQRVEVYVNRSFAYRTLGQFDKAAVDAAKAVSLDPDNLEVQIAYAGSLRLMGQYSDALQAAKRAVAFHPKNARVQYEVGVANRLLEKYPQALSALNKSIELDSNFSDAYSERARVLRAQGNNKRALEDCSAAIRFGSGEVAANAYILRGNIFADEKYFQKALADYNSAIKIDSQNSYGFLNRGVVYLEFKNYPRALKDLNQAIAVDPKNWLAFYNRGYAYQELEKFSPALSDFNQAIKLNPKSAASYVYRAQIFAHRFSRIAENGKKRLPITQKLWRWTKMTTTRD